MNNISSTTETQEMPEITPHQTMRGYTNQVRGVVHLPGGRCTITRSKDGSLRLWDVESGAQIGDVTGKIGGTRHYSKWKR
jgi:hypothetical protein